MAETRSADDLIGTVADLRKELGDKIDTLLARSGRRPVGTIEPVLRTTGFPAYTLPLLGQAVSRTTYAELWEWAQTYSAVDGTLFGPGDGSTTFTLPNVGGRFIVGAGTLDTEGYSVGDTGGQVWQQLTTAELPTHDHGWSAEWNIASDGSHTGHTSGSFATQSGAGNTIPNSFNQSGGSHAHTFTFDLTIDDAGSGGEYDQRPPWLALPWVVWW
ncbi:MAG: tail fiber protein [Vicinamibacterales bacterium]